MLRTRDLEALTMIIILQYFGWRSECVVELKMEDITIKKSKISIGASRFKT